MRIQHNIMAMNAYRNYTNNTSALSKNLEKLSSGYKINRAGDDAAGLAISEKMRAQITGLQTAQKNAKDGISLVQTAEGALTEVHDMLNRMVELATQSANGTYDNETDRANLQKEISQLKSEIDRIADSANFNGIKLLDGSQAAEQLSKLPVEFNTVSAAAGVTVDNVQDGGGTNGAFTLDIEKMFTNGDTIKIEGTTDGSTAIAGGITLTAGTDFKGDTAEEQAQSLANAMIGQGDLASNFDITVDGTKVTLTAKKEGTENGGTITKITTTNADVNATATASTPAADGGTNTYQGALELIGGTDATGTAAHLEQGDKLTFKFKDAAGRDLEVELTVTEEMANANAGEAINAITAALEEATFKDNADTTGVDESQMKVGDLFTLTANKDSTAAKDAFGSINFEANSAGMFAVASVEINRGGAKTTVAAVTETAADAAAAGDAQVYTITAGAQDFSTGDKVKFGGTLANGSTFEVELTAGTDFEVGTNAAGTAANLVAALQSDQLSIKVTNADGSTSTITGKDLFGAKGEFAAAVSGNNVTVTSKNKGTAGNHYASNIDGITVTPLDEVKVTKTQALAKAQTSAESSFTVDSKLEYGTAIKVGDKTYEIVADARDTSNRNNTAIVVSDLSDSKAVAAALATAIGNNEADYNVTADNNGTVTISSKAIGSDQKALAISTPYGNEVTTASFQFDPSVVSEGSVLEFNGNTYEFVAKGGAAKTAGAIAIEVEDFATATSKSLGDAFADVAKNGVVTVANDGTVTLRGVEAADGTISKPSISFKEGLRLQIGDTSDSFNKLNVQIEDMHCKSLGIDDLDISNQKGAEVAIDKIKSAINQVSSVRGTLGATQNRLDHTINNLSVMTENIQDAESAIRDTDVAAEMMEYTKNNILVQSAQAMLAQANQVPQGVLQLLG